MIDNRTKSIPTSSSEVGIYYVYISQGNKDNGVYIVSDFVLPITVTKIAELYIGDSTKANLDGGNIFNGDQIINGDIIIQDITANNFLGNASTATKLKTFVNINGVAFDGSSNITIYDSTKEDIISVGTVFQYFRGDKTWQTLNKIVVGLSNVDNTADANKNVLSATKLTIPRTINNVSFDGSENIVINAVDITPRVPISYMGIANGVATLDNTGIIPITQLPSYVDDVIEVANYASLPVIGESGKIYVTTNNNKTYRWSGSVYVYITSGAVDSVNGYTGVVVLTKSDFILGNVDNTSDANKPISIATQGALDLKQNLLTLGNFTSTTPGITISNGNGAVIGSGITFNITTAGTTTGGLITSGHWNTFNNKWDSSNHPITTLGYGLPDYPTTLPASDVYSWAKQSTKPTYAYSEITSKPTLLSQFINDLGNYGGWITGINSGMVTTALGYTPWHSGNHPTTISGYGITDMPTYSGTNFILNQNDYAQSANMWISGQVRVDNAIVSQINGSNTVGAGARVGLLNSDGDRFMLHQLNASNGEDIWSFDGTSYRNVYSLSYLGVATFASTVNATQFQSIVATGTAPLTVNSTTMVGNLNAQYLGGYENAHFAKTYNATYLIDNWNNFNPSSSTDRGVIVRVDDNVKLGLPQKYIYNWSLYQQGNSMRGSQLALGAYGGNEIYYRSAQNDDNIWRPWVKVYHSGNLTNNLSTNCIPKWNGSSFGNSVIQEIGGIIYWGGGGGQGGLTWDNGWAQVFSTDSNELRLISGSGTIKILNTTPSTSPTTGALVVGGGIGVGGTINATNYIGKSNGFYTVQITQAAYTALGTKDASTIYMIVG